MARLHGRSVDQQLSHLVGFEPGTLVGVARGGPAQGAEPLGSQSAPVPDTVAVPNVLQAEAEDPLAVELERVMEGHGNGGGTQPGVAQAGTGSTPSPSGTVEVVMNFTANEPVEQRKPGAEIAAAHRQPGAMGWTTPAYSVRGRPGGTRTGGVVDATLDFTIELLKSIEGGRSTCSGIMSRGTSTSLPV